MDSNSCAHVFAVFAPNASCAYASDAISASYTISSVAGLHYTFLRGFLIVLHVQAARGIQRHGLSSESSTRQLAIAPILAQHVRCLRAERLGRSFLNPQPHWPVQFLDHLRRDPLKHTAHRPGTTPVATHRPHLPPSSASRTPSLRCRRGTGGVLRVVGFERIRRVGNQSALALRGISI
eukprot:6214514-Pleurochrysis_carterae.AAC.3